MRSWRRSYGAGPWHLLGVLACFAVAAYAVTRVFAQGGWKAILVWFVICVILHDGVGWPIYAVADRVLTRRARPGAARGGPGVTWINHVRVPTVISGLLFVMFAPMIFRLSKSTSRESPAAARTSICGTGCSSARSCSASRGRSSW